jgi:hypothetical protein
MVVEKKIKKLKRKIHTHTHTHTYNKIDKIPFFPHGELFRTNKSKILARYKGKKQIGLCHFKKQRI